MPKFHYAKYGQSWGFDCDDELYAEARDSLSVVLSIPAPMVDYVIQYAVNQITQDSMAQPAASAKAEGDDVAAASIAAANKRWDAVRAGTVGVRTGGFRVTDPFDAAIRDLCDAAIDKALKKPENKGKKRPKGDELIKVRAAIYAANKSQFDEKAKAAVDALAAIPDVVL